MRLPYLLAAGAALGAADDGAPRAQTQGKERNPPAWPAAVRVVAPAQCAEISAADAGAALLLLPGVYDCSISLPSRSTAAGLGTDRDDVLLKRCVGDAASSAENLRVDGDWRGPRSVRRVAVAGDAELRRVVAGVAGEVVRGSSVSSRRELRDGCRRSKRG